MKGHLEKVKEYNQNLYLCGSHNSYSKTDHDATFMRMKEDAMMNGQLNIGKEAAHQPIFNLLVRQPLDFFG